MREWYKLSCMKVFFPTLPAINKLAGVQILWLGSREGAINWSGSVNIQASWWMDEIVKELVLSTNSSLPNVN